MEIEDSAKAPEITTSLFSFKTFRSPDKISQADKNQFFIHYPDLAQGLFNQDFLLDTNENSRSQTEDFVRNLQPVRHYREIRAMNIDFYDYSCLLMEQRRNDSSRPPFDDKTPRPLAKDVYLRVWEELFIQIVTQQSTAVRQTCVQLIMTQFYIENKERLSLNDIVKLAVVIPDILIDWIKTLRYNKCGGNLFGVHNLGIEEYRKVEQTLCCYVPGEISHIENIMASEYKEKSTRNLLRTENTTELSSETEIENLNDTTTAERNELSSEVAKELRKDQSFDVSGSVTVNKGVTKSFGMSANVSTGYNNSSSSALSNTEAKNYAKEVTERALERIVQKTTEKRTFKMIKEFEENNKHGFDNTGGIQHVTGVYRWVDKIYDNRLVNYGKRLVLEIEVPNPALVYKKAMQWKSKKEESEILTPPKALTEFKINSSSDINDENINNVTEAAAYYGVNVEWPILDKIKTFSLTYNGLGYKGDVLTTEVHTELIEENYSCYKIVGSFNVNYKGNRTKDGKVVSYFHFGNDLEGEEGYYAKGTKDENKVFAFTRMINPAIESNMSFFFRYKKVGTLSGSFSLHLHLNDAIQESWQKEVYAELQQAYNKLKTQYDEEIKQQQAEEQAKADQEKSENYSNPALNRLIEERELKRSCIEMMSRPYCYDFGKRFYDCRKYTCTTCEEDTLEAIIPEIIQNQELENYADFIKFFETAFQWEIFTYIFYPYYYNEKCTWYELMQTKSDDPIFEAFLQSGMAKILVPIRPQFEKSVLWYLETGEIATECDIVPETADNRYETLLGDLGKQDERKVEGKWKTRIPSTLTIIQAESAYFEDEKGLPCCGKNKKSSFGSDGRVLKPKEDKPKE